MKKGICILLMLVTMIALSACGNDEDQVASGSGAKSKAKDQKVSEMKVEVPDDWRVKKVHEDEVYDAQLIFHGDVDENGTTGDKWTSCIIDEEVQCEPGQKVEDLFEEYTKEIEQQVRESDDVKNVQVWDETYDGTLVRFISYMTMDNIEAREAFVMLDDRIISITMNTTIPEDAKEFEAIVKSLKAQ